MTSVDDIPKGTQDTLGLVLSKWRNSIVKREIEPPLLDIACGVNLLARMFEGGIGVDIQDYGDTDLVVDSFNSLPYDPGTFKSVTIVASLYYFDDPREVLTECARVLTDDGKIILTLLNPLVGSMWHAFREPWAQRTGFAQSQLEECAGSASLRIVKRRRFMFGVNNLFVQEKQYD